MENFVDEGKVKSIGLSNFNISQIKEVLEKCRIKPVVNQVEVHPYFQNTELVDFCQTNDIIVTAYAPLGAPDRSWYIV
jgi:diketogulonate reductase-like aldo/keto reductase